MTCGQCIVFNYSDAVLIKMDKRMWARDILILFLLAPVINQQTTMAHLIALPYFENKIDLSTEVGLSRQLSYICEKSFIEIL